MKAFQHWLVAGLGLLAVYTGTASAREGFFFNPYVAVEEGYRHAPWESLYGERHFRENFRNTNFILGAQVHEYFAVEGGFQTTDRREKQEFYMI